MQRRQPPPGCSVTGRELHAVPFRVWRILATVPSAAGRNREFRSDPSHHDWDDSHHAALRGPRARGGVQRPVEGCQRARGRLAFARENGWVRSQRPQLVPVRHVSRRARDPPLAHPAPFGRRVSVDRRRIGARAARQGLHLVRTRAPGPGVRCVGRSPAHLASRPATGQPSSSGRGDATVCCRPGHARCVGVPSAQLACSYPRRSPCPEGVLALNVDGPRAPDSTMQARFAKLAPPPSG